MVGFPRHKDLRRKSKEGNWGEGLVFSAPERVQGVWDTQGFPGAMQDTVQGQRQCLGCSTQVIQGLTCASLRAKKISPVQGTVLGTYLSKHLSEI